MNATATFVRHKVATSAELKYRQKHDYHTFLTIIEQFAQIRIIVSYTI
jgi:hypothetical protein